MKMLQWLSSLSLSGVYFGCFLLVLVTLGGGYLLGRHLRARDAFFSDTSIGSAVAAVLGLLAFMLAFTFNLSAERFGQRKALLLEDVNALGTTYLRADFLDEAGRREARALLREYASVRSFNPSEISLEEFLRLGQRSDQIQQSLWQLVARHEQQGYDPQRLRAFYEPLNQLIDTHTLRVQIGHVHRIPAPIWLALYSITALAMLGMGLQLGVSGAGSMVPGVALAVAFSLVILLITDLDRSYEGWLLVDQAPMAELAEVLARDRD